MPESDVRSVVLVVKMIRMTMTALCVQDVLTGFTALTVLLHADNVQPTRSVTRPRDVVQVDVRPVIRHTFAIPVSVT